MTRAICFPLRTLSIGALAVCAVAAQAQTPVATDTEEGRGINLSYMDPTADPATDFFRYVNGRWLDNTEIPDDRTRWGSFDELRKNTDAQTLDVLNAAIESGEYDEDSDQGKAANYFALVLDTAHRNALGTQPIEDRYEKIQSIDDLEDVYRYELLNMPWGGNSLFGFYIGSDPMNSNEKAVSMYGGALGLPDRDYYLDEDSASVDRRDKYVAHVARMLGFLGYDQDESTSAAERVLAFETAIAETKLDKVARRDPYKRYNPTATSALPRLEGMDGDGWEEVFDKHDLATPDTVIVGETAYYEYLGELMSGATDFDLVTIKDYLAWQLIDGAAGSLSMPIERANWEFYSRELRGAQAERPLEERALSSVNRALGEAVGKLYVDKYFPAEAKAQAEELVANLREAYANRIEELEWMSPATKEQALGKLNTFRVKIGYPDEWKDYFEIEIEPVEDGGSLFAAARAVREYNFHKDIREADEPVDKDEWFMSPQTVNAYYNPAYNEIVFPAAIMQPPFYDYQADAAVNYGGIGAVIGHEISHGFDDKGSQYDKDGNLKSWWTDDDREAFDARTQKLSDQYSAYEPLPGVMVNGDFTLGENIGDLGGVNAAYDGLQLHLAEHGRPGLIDGLTPEQRFFISWGTIWRTKYRDKALENQVKTDPHSPGMYRASGPLLNLQTFYDAFDIEPGDEGYVAPEDRVVIW